MDTALAAKQLGLLHQLPSRALRSRGRPTNPQTQSTLSELEAAASVMDQQFEAVTATT